MLQVSLHAAAIYGHVRVLVAVDPSTGMCVGALPATREPNQPWLDVAGYATRYIFVNERVSGHGSLATCVSPFLLGGPCKPEGGGPDEGGGFSLGSEQQHGHECHLHVAYRRWSTTRSELDVGFHNCRLAVYYERVMEVVSQCIRPFRQAPHERLWMSYEGAAPFKDMQYVTLPRDDLARRGRLPPSTLPTTAHPLPVRSLSVSCDADPDMSSRSASQPASGSAYAA